MTYVWIFVLVIAISAVCCLGGDYLCSRTRPWTQTRAFDWAGVLGIPFIVTYIAVTMPVNWCVNQYLYRREANNGRTNSTGPQ